MKTDTVKMLAEGKMSQTLLRLCLPAVIAMAINGIYNVVDAYFIGLTGNTGAIGAISVIFPLFIVMTAFGMGLSVGAGSFMSRCLGIGTPEKAKYAGSAALLFSVVLGIVVTVLGFVFMEPMLYLLGARDTIMPYAVDYTSLILFGSVFVILNLTFMGTIRAEGNTIYPTVALLAGTVLNIILDPIFIFAFALGIKGAAIATLISYVVTFIISAMYYITRRSAIKLRPKPSHINRENIIEIAKIGVPAMLKQLLLAVVFCMINMLSATHGEDAVTAAGICAKVHSFVAMTLLGITQGFMPVASFNFGAKNYPRVFDAVKKVLFIEVAFSIVCACAYIIFNKEIVAIFCREPSIIGIGSKFLVAYAVGIIPLAVVFLMEALFFSCGKAKASMLLSVSRQGVIFIPLILIGNALMGLNGIVWASAAADFLCCLFIVLPLFVRFVRRLSNQSTQQTACIEQIN